MEVSGKWNIQEKAVKITGANSGIGKATTMGLAKRGATVVMVCRDRQRGEEARAAIVTESGGQAVDLLQGEKWYRESEAYSHSKLCNILFTYELARQLERTGVTVNCLDPGGVRTNLSRDFHGLFRVLIKVFWPFMRTPDEGAENPLYLATSRDTAGINDELFFDKREAKTAQISYNTAVAQQLWQVSEQLMGLG